MYFDAVYHGEKIVKNLPPENIVDFLLNLHTDLQKKYFVIRGEDLRSYSVDDYLELMKV